MTANFEMCGTGPRRSISQLVLPLQQFFNVFSYSLSRFSFLLFPTHCCRRTRKSGAVKHLRNTSLSHSPPAGSLPVRARGAGGAHSLSTYRSLVHSRPPRDRSLGVAAAMPWHGRDAVALALAAVVVLYARGAVAQCSNLDSTYPFCSSAGSGYAPYPQCTKLNLMDDRNEEEEGFKD